MKKLIKQKMVSKPMLSELPQTLHKTFETEQGFNIVLPVQNLTARLNTTTRQEELRSGRLLQHSISQGV